MAIRLRPSSHRADLALVLLVVVLFVTFSSTVSAVTTTPGEQYGYHRSRRLLVTAPRVSPEMIPTGAQKQEMDVTGWRAATPFLGARANLGRRIPRSRANPSHN
jgi:hypothetical protein